MASAQSSGVQKYNDIIERCRGIHEMHPLFKALTEDGNSHRILVAVFEHERDTIRTRSQDLNDSEITAAQKAFSSLVDHNPDAATHIYVDEMLGVKLTPDAEKLTTLKNVIEVRGTLLQMNSDVPHSAFARSPHSNAIVTPTDTCSQDSIPAGSLVPLSSCEKMLSRLESLIINTHKEFHEAQEDTYEQRESAKFLRDTIDNFDEYVTGLRETQPNFGPAFYEDKLMVFRDLRAKANCKALQGYNGKPRPFERTQGNFRFRPTLKRENTVLRSPRTLRKSTVNSLHVNREGVQRGGGKFARVDKYRPIRHWQGTE